MKNKYKWLIGLIPVSFLIILFAKNNLSFAEYYSVNIYPVFLKTWGLFSFKTNISLTELIIIIGTFTIIVLTIVVIFRTLKNRKSQYVKKYALGMVSFFSVILFLFVLFCGINYHRHEFTYYSGLEIKDSSIKELVNLCEILIEDANRSREKLSEGQDGKLELFDDYYGTAERAKTSMNKLAEEYEILRGEFPSPKPVRNSKIMSYLGIMGVFFPFTFEANINVDIPSFRIPAVMLHELVHLRGFMREDEANFIAYLASINSGYDDFYYSGTMMALTYSMNALYTVDYGEFMRLYNLYSADVKKDIEFSNAYWRQFDTKIAEISNRINNVYLKVNDQEDGVKSYGRMVDLLLAYYR